MATHRYTVTIAFNHGRDAESRIDVSKHTSPRAAVRSYLAARSDRGWTPRVECCDADALAELRDAALYMTTTEIAATVRSAS